MFSHKIAVMKKSKFIAFALLLLSFFIKIPAFAVTPGIYPLPKDHIEAAIDLADCNTRNSPCVLPGDEVKNVVMTGPLVSAQFEINIPDLGGFLDWFDPGYNETLRAKYYASEFVRSLCLLKNGYPKTPIVKILKTASDGADSISVNSYPFAHATNYDSGSFTFTIGAAVSCTPD